MQMEWCSGLAEDCATALKRGPRSALVGGHGGTGWGRSRAAVASLTLGRAPRHPPTVTSLFVTRQAVCESRTHRTSSVSPGYSDLLTRGRLTRSSASSLSSASSPICGMTRVGKVKSPTKRNEGQYLMCSRRWRPAAWCSTAPSVTPKPSASQWMVFHCSKLPSSALHAARQCSCFPRELQPITSHRAFERSA